MNSLYIYFFLHVTSENFDQNSHANFLLLYLEPVSDYYDSDRLVLEVKKLCVYMYKLNGHTRALYIQTCSHS